MRDLSDVHATWRSRGIVLVVTVTVRVGVLLPIATPDLQVVELEHHVLVELFVIASFQWHLVGATAALQQGPQELPTSWSSQGVP